MYLISKMNFPFISLRFRHNAVNLLLSYAHQKFSVHQCSVCMCLHNYQNSRITKFLNLTSHQLLSLCTWAKSFQFSSVAQQCLTLCDPTDCSTPGFPVHHQLCRPIRLLPSIFPSIRVFSSESVLCIMWPKYWSFSFSISTSNEYSRLLSFRIDWQDLLTVQGTLESLLQQHTSKASILQCSAFFIVQLSHPYMTTEKITYFTR